MGLPLDLLSAHLPPIRTAAAAAAAATPQVYDGGDTFNDDGCATPTSPANVPRAPPVCPPAPRKPRPRPAKRWERCVRRRWVVAVPLDLAAVFVARRPAASPCRPPAGKKMRVHVVG